MHHSIHFKICRFKFSGRGGGRGEETLHGDAVLFKLYVSSQEQSAHKETRSHGFITVFGKGINRSEHVTN